MIHQTALTKTRALRSRHRLDNYNTQYAQGNLEEGEEDIRKVQGIADDNDFDFPFKEI